MAETDRPRARRVLCPPAVTWVAALGLALPPAALAAPAVVVIDLVGDLDVTAQRALRSAVSGSDSEADATAVAAVDRAELAFLEVNLAAAEADLVRALGHFFGRPLTVSPAVAYGAAIRLAQVLVASKRADAAERLLERALETWSAFPGDSAVPPDLTRALRSSRRKAATRLVGRLRIESEPSGLRARVGSRDLGATPANGDKLPLGGAEACVDGPLGERCRRIEVGRGAQTVRLVADAPGARAELARSLREHDLAVGRTALAGVSAAVDEAPWCLVVAAAEVVTIAEVKGARPARGTQARRPRGPADWGGVGTACVAPGALALDGAAVEARLWAETPAAILDVAGGEPTSPGGTDPRWWLGWGAAGAGVAAAGVGVGLGLSAADAADAFNRTGRAADEDRARGQAVGADIAYVAGAALLATGIYLLLTSD